MKRYYGSYRGRCLREVSNECNMSLKGSGAADHIPSRSLSEITGKMEVPCPPSSPCRFPLLTLGALALPHAGRWVLGCAEASPRLE